MVATFVWRGASVFGQQSLLQGLHPRQHGRSAVGLYAAQRPRQGLLCQRELTTLTQQQRQLVGGGQPRRVEPSAMAVEITPRSSCSATSGSPSAHSARARTTRSSPR